MALKSEQIYQSLRRGIIRLEIPPGTSLSEKELGKQFGSSRTPVHEAVQRLSKDGLVSILPQSGTYVQKLSRKTAGEGFIIRRALEIEAIRRAVTRITPQEIDALRASLDEMQRIQHEGRLIDYVEVDDDFHARIAAASGLDHIWRFINQAKVHLDRLRHLSMPVPGHVERVHEQHRQIVDALEHRDPDRAELSLRIHLESAYAVMSRLSEQQAHLFDDDAEAP